MSLGARWLRGLLRTCCLLLGRTRGCVRQMRNLPLQPCARPLNGQAQISIDSHGFGRCWQLSSGLCLFMLRQAQPANQVIEAESRA